MSQKTLALIHTSATLVPVFQKLAEQYIPNVKVFNIVDDSLVKCIINDGSLKPNVAKRVAGYAQSAELGGADYAMFTCSSIGAAVEAAQFVTNIPVLRVDKPMADLAVATGKKIGVIATLPTTLYPTSDLVKRSAEAAGKEVDIIAKVCEGAFDALMSGDAAKHDEMVASALKELYTQVDVILLAQASMARVVDTLPEEFKQKPILASPPIAMEHIRDIVSSLE